ncbi:restriction endonuclease subunit S [Leyella stercorea]|uniref:restriction endonuclease subunit S n=1 Tax=Leyella stercorea TaxID=363265 RepID=UPI0040279536
MRLRIKDICDYVSRGTTPDYVDEAVNKVMNQATFSKGWIDESNIRYTSKTNKGARIMKGDLLMASTGGGVLGKVFFFDDDNSFYADSHVTIMRNSKGANLMKYLYYYFYLRYDEINATMVKGSTNQTELQRNYLLSYELDVPTLADQQRMVTYLDTKLSEIDHQVSLLTSKRDAYLRLKKSIINHAVTHGLNPNVKMKDSGIEWIGEVPEHWEMCRFKDAFRRWTTGITPDSKNYKYFESDICKGYTWVTISDFLEKYISQSNLNLSDESIKLFMPPLSLKGSLMFSFKLSVGKIAFADKDLYTNEAIVSIPPNNGQCLEYYYYMLPNVLHENATENIYGAKMLNQKIIANMLMVVPPLPEQRAIATYLDDKCSKIETIVSNLDKQISRYGDLKRSLIDEVITGKRAV